MLEVLGVATRLGLTSFGGPVAHLGYFREEYVERRRWLDERDLRRPGRALPVPARSGEQPGGHRRSAVCSAGCVGGLAAWLGFTLPSALRSWRSPTACRARRARAARAGCRPEGAAVAVVAQASGAWRATSARTARARHWRWFARVALLLLPAAWRQVGVIALGGASGWRLFRGATGTRTWPLAIPRVARAARLLAAWSLFFRCCSGCRLLRGRPRIRGSRCLTRFYRAGSLVFGGGHVVLPLLEREVVPPGWVSDDQFLAGYGAAQALPGPLFTFSAYLGAVMHGRAQRLARRGCGRWSRSSCLVPAGRRRPAVLAAAAARAAGQAALRGANAAVVGVLLAALYNPVWTAGDHRCRATGAGARGLRAAAVVEAAAMARRRLAAAGGQVLAALR